MIRPGKPHPSDTHTIRIDAPFYQAGLAGYSDTAMRLVARRHGCPYCITEAMLDQFLINGGRGLAAAELDDADHPIAGQLMGSHPKDIAAGAKVLVGLGYDVVDVNLACPVKKIKRKARGGHLLSVPDEAAAILDAVAQAVGADVPMTLKLRRGYDDSPEAETGFRRIMEAAIDSGYAGATVHGRTVEQKYVGPSSWAHLKSIVVDYGGESVRFRSNAHRLLSVAPQRRETLSVDTENLEHGAPGRFLLGGSGDIWCAADIFRMLEQTGVGWVSVARGCIGNPWVFRQARAILHGTADPTVLPSPTIHEQRDVLREHFELSVAQHGERQASRMMRKFGIKFSRHHPERHGVKDAFIHVKTLSEWHWVLNRFYAEDGPGQTIDQSMPEESAYAACDPVGAGAPTCG